MPRNRNLSGKFKQGKCWQMNEMIVIKADGNMQLCCNDWQEEGYIGHISEGIWNVLNNDIANTFKNNINNGNLPLMCQKCVVFWEGD